MKNSIGMLLAAILISFITACGLSQSGGFEGSDVFIADFDRRSATFNNQGYFSVLDGDLSVEQRQALQFLYAYMPLPDIADYSGDFYLMNVDYALRARKEMPWGKSVPDREFLHFVLPVRVNNEDMDESRSVFFEELKERVKGLSMYDAVLEVNHWCHEKVTYTPSDARTSAPLATVRTAHGRCGEESTFTVAALRSVGIPARQVYTPRWAHTDDNHAWVEAWVDGKWHFLGACEPEPVLDLGWFNAPASRGMLMHTKAFGNYKGPEEVVGVTPCYTEINVTSNYAPTATTIVRVVDAMGNPVRATVDFKIYNYAEFFTAARRETDVEGYTSLTTGCGDMLAWASKDGCFGYGKISAGVTDTLTVVLDKGTGYCATEEMDITPPAERSTAPEVTPEQRAANDRRFAIEDSIRNAYVATFPTREDAAGLAHELSLPAGDVQMLLQASRGNHKTITDYLRNAPADKRKRAFDLLFYLSAKDLRDISPEVLADHVVATLNTQTEDEDFFRYVLNPRVSNEMLTPYRTFFANAIDADSAALYRANPQMWVEWCRNNIAIDKEWNPLRLCMSPAGVWSMRMADTHSRDIFFVSAARSMGIPARIDEVTGKTQYSLGDKWCDVDFSNEEVEPANSGRLYATYTPTRFIDNPRYYSHFSIAKIVNGRAVLQNHPEQATWATLLKDGLTMDEGSYLMTTGTRMANGGVLAHLTFFEVVPGEKTDVALVQRENKDKLQVIGNFNSENLFFDLNEQRSRSLLSATGRGYYIIALIDPNSEPTNHFLRDVAPYKEAFEQWGQKMVLLFRNRAEADRFRVCEFQPLLPSTVVWGTDIDDKIRNEIVTAMKLKSPNNPVILVADTFNRIVFMSQGYSIGLGEQLVKVLNMLDD
ncbi:MAG: transglutaminase domain-containing protein [Bacteroidaceae bacterium]|nr:transglutaminase domain-containing protein [Bacteroidaceae bacterium]